MFTLDNLPNLLKQLEEFQSQLTDAKLPTLWEQLDQCQNAMQEAHGSLGNPKKKEMLGELLGELSKARTECEKMVPDIEQEFKKQMQSLDRIKDLSAQLEQTEQALDDRLRADAELAESLQSPLPAELEIPLDANHGAGLEQELLQLLGMLETVTRKGSHDDGSIARMWSEAEAGEHGESVSSPAKASPTAAPDRPALKPRTSTPLSKSRREAKPKESEPASDESIGRMTFEDE